MIRHRALSGWSSPMAAAVVATLLSSALACHPRPRLIDLGRLSEKEARAALQRAAPADVFVLRDRRFAKRDVESRMAAVVAAAQERHRARLAAAPLESTALFDSQRRQLALDRQRAAEKALARYQREVDEAQRQRAVADPRVGELRLELVRLVPRLESAAPEQQRALEARWHEIAAELARLGAPLPADPPALPPPKP